ncbi:hypothetical protein BVI434_1110023 [Burkholderia vietnamiensis]|nr:hypothetical protein BVI434_1110023 [Burkholderia vietnamiensis]
MPGKVDAGRGNADPVAGPDRQDLTIAPRAPHGARHATAGRLSPPALLGTSCPSSHINTEFRTPCSTPISRIN